MDMILLAIPFGLAIGLVVGTVGGGGAILALPILVYVLGEGVSPASTASLIVVALGASVGAGAHAREGHLCARVALAFSAPAALGAYGGTIANGSVGARTLVLAFVPVMLAAALLTHLRARGASPEPLGADAGCPRPGSARTIGSGLVVGAMTGFFGVGGGFLIVPALTTMLGLPVRRAIATSLAIITLTAIAALASHMIHGAQPDWPLTLALCGAAALGALSGASAGRRLPARALADAFAAVVVLVAAFLLADVLALGGPPTG
jgi:uncharacterized membrane protein YfcA